MSYVLRKGLLVPKREIVQPSPIFRPRRWLPDTRRRIIPITAALSRTNVISTNTPGQIATGSLTSGSFTPASSSLLVVIYHMQSSLTTFSPTITDNLGTHLIYTNQVQIGPDTTNHHATAIFTAPVGTGAAMTVTCGGGPSDGTYEAIVHVYTYTGYNTGSPVGAKASGNNVNFGTASSITLSAAPALTSEVIAGFQDDVGTIVVGAGWTTQFTGTDTLNIFSLDETRTNSTSTVVAWANSGSGVVGVAAAIEILAAVPAKGGTLPLMGVG